MLPQKHMTLKRTKLSKERNNLKNINKILVKYYRKHFNECLYNVFINVFNLRRQTRPVD